MGKPMNQLSREEKFPLLLGHLAELTVNFDELYFNIFSNKMDNSFYNPSLLKYMRPPACFFHCTYAQSFVDII